MAIAELISAEQYLHSSFEHDADLWEEHSSIARCPPGNTLPCRDFRSKSCGSLAGDSLFFAVPEQPVQTRRDRYRVPAVCVVTEKPEGEPGRRIVSRPPYLAVEILSPEDTAVETMEKVGEYLHFGVSWVWVIDPVALTGQVHSQNGVVSIEDRVFSTDLFSVDLSKAEI